MTFQKTKSIQLLIGAILCTAAQAKTVSNLSEVTSQISNPDHQAVYEQQMNGTPLPDGFGVSLPENIKASDILNLINPKQENIFPTLMGLKRWPYAQDTYVAIVCSVSDENKQKEQLEYNSHKPVCNNDDETSISLALMTYQKSTLKLTSSIMSWGNDSTGPLAASWSDSNLEGPIDGDMIEPTELYRFDFTNYKISNDITAFGIRAGLTEGYAGGIASFQTLTLFAVIDGKLTRVLSQPISFMKVLAGDWNDDGTRSHDVSEGSNVVIISKPDSSGFNEIIVKSTTSNESRTFSWNNEIKTYVPS